MSADTAMPSKVCPCLKSKVFEAFHDIYVNKFVSCKLVSFSFYYSVYRQSVPPPFQLSMSDTRRRLRFYDVLVKNHKISARVKVCDHFPASFAAIDPRSTKHLKTLAEFKLQNHVPSPECDQDVTGSMSKSGHDDDSPEGDVIEVRDPSKEFVRALARKLLQNAKFASLVMSASRCSNKTDICSS